MVCAVLSGNACYKLKVECYVMRASRGMGCMSEKKLKKLKEGGTVKDACYKKVKAQY
jgi:hypothetical protein